jgi:hypothetical protein
MTSSGRRYNPLIRRLRSAGVTERGGITMTELETVISTAADRAQQQILAPEIDAIEAFTAWVRSREIRSGHDLWLEY